MYQSPQENNKYVFFNELNETLSTRPKFFQKKSTVVTGLGDFHKMIISCLKTAFKKIPQKRLFSEIIKSLMNKIFFTISINK